MANDHPIWQLIESVSTIGIHSTSVQLKCMDEDELREVMSNTLCLSPRIVRFLSNIVFKKTKGNPLFFSQMLLSLNRNGLICLNYDSQRWVWEEDKIYSMKLPDNVAICFAKSISKVPFEVQLALRTLSMFGAAAQMECIEELEKKLNLELTEPLKTAAAEGLVNHVQGSIQFSYDLIQEVVYGMIPEQGLHNHLVYGTILVQLSQRKRDVDMI
jgi:predicted ATPase